MSLNLSTCVLCFFLWLGGVSAGATPPALTSGADPSCPYETLAMLSKYGGEEVAGGYYTTAVPYLNESQRMGYQVFIHDGLLVHADGRPVDAHRASLVGAELFSLQAIYIMDECGRVFLTYHHEVGLFHHSSFLSGDPVSAAGEMLVVDGRILEIDSASGHYRPPPEATRQLIHRLHALGADLSMAQISL